MGKRIGRKRLFALNKKGQTSTQTAGSGIKSAIGSQTEIREGSLITTDIQLDLGTSAAAIASVGTAGIPAGAGSAVIGVAALTSSLVTVGSSQGVLTSAEFICVEAPSTGEDNIGVFYADNVLSSSMTMAQATNPVQLIAAEAYTAAGKSAANTDIDADIDGKYIYLVSSGSTAGTYDGGKFILRLFGYEVFSDVV